MRYGPWTASMSPQIPVQNVGIDEGITTYVLAVNDRI